MSNPIWDRFCDHATTWFHEPDLHALEILASNIYAHTHLSDPPAWIFFIGPSSSGKTKLGIEPFVSVPRAFRVADISSAGFYSVDKSKKIPTHHGLLVESGNPGNAIWLFQDFTTTLTKDRHDFDAIMAALREIHDGARTRDIGQVKRVSWSGKITCHAACTPALESALATNRDFGERFLLLRLRSPKDITGVLRKARQQNGHAATIDQTSQSLIASLISTPPPCPPITDLSPESESILDALAILTTKLSIVGRRNSQHKLIEIGEEAFPGRLIQSVQTVLRGHAMLFNHSTFTESEFHIARRLLIDTIPSTRRKILFSVPAGPSGTTVFEELQRQTGIPPTTLRQELETLSHANVLINLDGVYFWTPAINNLIEQSGVIKLNK